MQTPILQLQGIRKYFPGVQALDGIELTVQPGEVHALMGENGAGKSTLIKVIAGVHAFDAGEYRIDGAPANIKTPGDAIARGISVIYQELNLVNNLSVAENICFGNFPKKGRILDWKQMLRSARQALAEVGLDLDPQMKVGCLPIAKQQLVEIAKALMTKPKLVIMDEPTSSLSTAEIENLFSVIARLKAQGVAVIYVSHKLEEVYAISDRITVLRDGQYIATKACAELPEEALIHLMVGREVQSAAFAPQQVGQDIALRVAHLSTDHVRDVSFHLRPGEIVGLAGLMGAGRSELARAVIGADKRLSGTVEVGGQVLPKDCVPAAKKLGIGFVSEDRKGQGIIAGQSVRFNTTLSSLKQITRRRMLSAKMEAGLVADMIQKLHIKVSTPEHLITTLSGGNQQKVLLGRCLANRDMRVLIIDEPTRGIDIGAKSEIYQILCQLAAQGISILMISSEIPEIMSLCNRTYVMKDGRIQGELHRADMSQERILSIAIGSKKENENAKA